MDACMDGNRYRYKYVTSKILNICTFSFKNWESQKSGGNWLIGHFRGVHYNNSLTFEQTHLLELFHNPIRARSHESSSAPKTKVSLLSRGTLLHVGAQGVIMGLLGGPGAV